MRDFEGSNHADLATWGGFRAIERYIGVKSCIGESVRNASSVNQSTHLLLASLDHGIPSNA
jgi:hypothetical protein